MKKFYFPILALIVLSTSSCDFFGVIFGSPEPPVYPRTEVKNAANYRAEVQILYNDSIYTIDEYWTDDNGKWLYTLSHKPYKNGRLHGKELRWNEWGDTLYYAVWDEGIPQDSMLEFYAERPQQLSRIVYYKKNGNKESEIYYHPNGKPRTDTILYVNGLREGPIDFYDSIPKNLKPTETYFYKQDKLIGVKIYKAIYDQLASRALGLELQIAKDSVNKLILSGEAEAANTAAAESKKSSNKDYKGNKSTRVDAEVW